MPKYIRAKFKGGEYFFTLVTFSRKPVLTSPLAQGSSKKSLICAGLIVNLVIF